MKSRSRLVGKLLEYFSRDRVFESHLRYSLLCSGFVVLIIFCIFDVQNSYIKNEFTIQKTNQTDRREIASISTSLRNSLCNWFCSDLSIFKNSIMQNQLQGQKSTDEQKLELIKRLFSFAKPEDFVRNISENFINGITEEMQNFELTGKEVGSKIALNQELVKFFYDLAVLQEKQRLQDTINSINVITS